jgi:uncharacterized protein involved in cysteine biosynthesis
MNRKALFREYFEQFLFTLHSFPEAVRFFSRHRLWEGFWRYGWVAKFLLIIGIIASYKFMGIFFESLHKLDTSSTTAALSSVGIVAQNLVSKELNFLFQSGMRYILLILMEILVFHVCTRTIDVLTNDQHLPTMQDFVKAEVRMIKVGAYAWFMESLLSGIIKGVGNVVPGFFIVQHLSIFILQCYFMGFTVIDNYFEQFGLNIRESARRARNYIGIVLAMGLTLQLFFQIPLVGAVIGPLLTGVAIALVMMANDDLHLLKKRHMEEEGDSYAVDQEIV